MACIKLKNVFFCLLVMEKCIAMWSVLLFFYRFRLIEGSRGRTLIMASRFNALHLNLFCLDCTVNKTSNPSHKTNWLWRYTYVYRRNVFLKMALNPALKSLCEVAITYLGSRFTPLKTLYASTTPSKFQHTSTHPHFFASSKLA